MDYTEESGDVLRKYLGTLQWFITSALTQSKDKITVSNPWKHQQTAMQRSEIIVTIWSPSSREEKLIQRSYVQVCKFYRLGHWPMRILALSKFTSRPRRGLQTSFQERGGENQSMVPWTHLADNKEAIKIKQISTISTIWSQLVSILLTQGRQPTLTLRIGGTWVTS